MKGIHIVVLQIEREYFVYISGLLAYELTYENTESFVDVVSNLYDHNYFIKSFRHYFAERVDFKNGVPKSLDLMEKEFKNF